jgi:adenine-specific DNA-methyltransferase
MFKEPKPCFVELMEVIQRLKPGYPPIAEIERHLAAAMEKHLTEFKEELAAMGLEYDEETKKQDPWRGIYPYCHAEYRNEDGTKVDEAEAEKAKAKIWVWRESDPSAPAGKQSETTKDPKNPNYRFYRPRHPSTKRPCPCPKRGWGFPYEWPDDNRESFVRLDSEERIVWGLDENKIPQFKRFSS